MTLHIVGMYTEEKLTQESVATLYRSVDSTLCGPSYPPNTNTSRPTVTAVWPYGVYVTPAQYKHVSELIETSLAPGRNPVELSLYQERALDACISTVVVTPDVET